MKIQLHTAIVLLLMGFSGFAQENPILIDSVQVIGNVKRSLNANQLSIEFVHNKMAGDVGQLMPLFSGIQLRSYGGLGGLKTISFRSLSANHTSVVSDYFSLSQTQSGQNDLGQLPVDFIQNLSLVWCDPISLNYPVHSKLAGSIVSIQTYLLPDNKKVRMNVGSQIGSFGQADGHALVSRRWNKWRVAAAGKIRRFNGNYPFSYRNGEQTVDAKRSNSDLFDQYAQFSTTYGSDSSAHQLHLELSENSYNKGLPGAVVFYNPTAGQRLFGGSGNGTFRHTYRKKLFSIASGISAQLQEVNYVDSTYLNTQGFLHQRYRTQEYGANTQARYHIRKHAILAGLEYRSEFLRSSAYSTSPKRNTADAIIGWQYRLDRFTFQAQSGFTYVDDHRPSAYKGKKVFWQPTAMISFNKNHLQTAVGFRYTVRQPSFTELYFNQYTLMSLKPEEAQLYWVRAGLDFQHKKWNINTWIQPFYTYQTNKILALPTKNLFVWSIQNIGRSDAFGTEANLSGQLFAGKTEHLLNIAYTYQYTRDLTNSSSASYRDHIAYMPLHSGTASYLFSLEKMGFGLSATYQGKRYTLNQNIPSNELQSFLLLDFSAWYKFNLHSHTFTVRGAINNITNQQYAYIRYFVMPGVNYTVNLLFSW